MVGTFCPKGPSIKTSAVTGEWASSMPTSALFGAN